MKPNSSKEKKMKMNEKASGKWGFIKSSLE